MAGSHWMIDGVLWCFVARFMLTCSTFPPSVMVAACSGLTASEAGRPVRCAAFDTGPASPDGSAPTCTKHCSAPPAQRIVTTIDDDRPQQKGLRKRLTFS
uniref:Putative secreted protein n=1 Tax=Anopheles darlingi TaxID=43151 RepID=A0A2M4DHD3_ANODA